MTEFPQTGFVRAGIVDTSIYKCYAPKRATMAKYEEILALLALDVRIRNRLGITILRLGLSYPFDIYEFQISEGSGLVF